VTSLKRLFDSRVSVSVSMSGFPEGFGEPSPRAAQAVLSSNWLPRRLDMREVHLLEWAPENPIPSQDRIAAFGCPLHA
jgi:hypothetical protein